VKKKGDWTYAVRAVHSATAINIWTGQLSAPQTFTCDGGWPTSIQWAVRSKAWHCVS
jgi:hypothetical protein